jgi:hypothetical protein
LRIAKRHLKSEELGADDVLVRVIATAIDDLAEVVDDGGTIINFGSLGSNMGTNSPGKTGIGLLKTAV